MREKLTFQEYVRKMQELDCQEAIRCQEVKEECWEDGEPMGRFKTQKATEKLMEALDNGK